MKDTDDQPKAVVVLAAGGYENRPITVWGKPQLLEIGTTYQFEITQDGEAFYEYEGVPACSRADFRLTKQLE